MKKWLSAFTLIELLVVIAIIAILAGMLLPALARAREEGRRSVCRSNISQMGKAIYAYTQNNGEFFPFSWGPANGRFPWPVGGVKWIGPYPSAPNQWPGNDWGTMANDCMTSIANLYPEYMDSAKVFRCPSTDYDPQFILNCPTQVTDNNADGVIDQNDAQALNQTYFWNNRNYSLVTTLGPNSYGYDSRIRPSMVSNHAILADMDGSYQQDRTTTFQNHTGGQNVLYVDGHVSWQSINFASNDPNDNIYYDNPWNADTDSLISDGTSYAKAGSYDPTYSMGSGAAGVNHLSKYMDEYANCPDLWPPR